MKRICLSLLFIFALSGMVFASPLISGSLSVDLAATFDESVLLNPGAEIVLNMDHFVQDAAFHLGIKGNYDESFWLELDEAYLDYYAEQFDFRFGKQRLSWGTALQINPTDVINPINIKDPLGEKQAVFAAALDYYIGHSTKLTGVWVPVFKPALSEIPHPMLPGVVVVPEKIEPKLKNSEFGIRTSFTGIKGWDMSLAYFRGWEPFPTPNIEPGMPPKISAVYAKKQMLGFDLATTLGDVGLWAEGAYTILEPEGAKNYYQFIVGADYGFQNGLVLIGQYFHNSVGEGTNNFMLAAEYPFGLMHSAKLGAVYNIDSNTFMLSPEVSFSVADSTFLSLGALYFSGDPGDLGMPVFGQSNNVYAKVKVGF